VPEPAPVPPTASSASAQPLAGADLVASLNGRMGELNEKLGIEFVQADSQSVTARMPVVGNRQPADLLHGGASAALAETLGSMHALLLAPAGSMPVGIELNCTHHRSATGGDVTGECTPIHVGRTLATFQIVVSDEAGRRVCSARLTCMYLPAR
jgi:1,4-dihydroxy-2-naphthoyl-CoA hydrolase